jgi:hypothetical protein
LGFRGVCCIAVGEGTPCRSHKHQPTDVRLLSDYRLLLGRIDASSERVGWIAMTIDDLRSNMDAASFGVSLSLGAATKPSALAATVVPLRQIPPTSPNTPLSPERLRQIDRVFFGPFFREKYGSEGDRALENSRIRYYGPVQPASDAGELAGRRYVHEFDTVTGLTRGWHETLDRMGNVRQIRPEWQDGIKRQYQFDGNGRYKGSW